VIKQQNIKNGYLRPVAWLGSETMLIAGNNCKVHTAIAGWETFEDTRKKLREKGSEVIISEWRKPPANCTPFASKAAGLYMIATMVKNQAAKMGFDDAILLDVNGNITEATTSNFFIIVNQKLITPIPDCFLDGLTRQTIIQIAKDKGIEVEEKHIKPEELSEGNAAFFTGTAIEVMPIKSITNGNKKYEFSMENSILKTLIDEYSKLVMA
jgi:branched-chain amino acid aminotransferase